MKKYKIASICYYVAAVASYIAAIIFFMKDNSNSLGAVWMCIGSAMLCLGSVSDKGKKSGDDEGENR